MFGIWRDHELSDRHGQTKPTWGGQGGDLASRDDKTQPPRLLQDVARNYPARGDEIGPISPLVAKSGKLTIKWHQFSCCVRIDLEVSHFMARSIMPSY
jgi:hypothetical protein